MKVRSLYRSVAKDLGIPEKRVSMIYTAYWNCIKEGIKSLDIHNGMTRDDFVGNKYGFVVQKIGRLYCDYKRYKSRNNKLLNLVNRRDAEDNKDTPNV